MEPSIVLTGFMGSGKSTIGKLLAKRLGRNFVDLDEIIEKTEGRQIPRIFAEDQEAGFRRIESRCLGQVLQEEGKVVATGGGVVERPENLAMIRRHIGVNLKVDAEIAYARAQADTTERPLAKKGKEAFTLLWQKRKPLYEKIQIQIDTAGATPEEIVQRILKSTGIGAVQGGR